MVATLIYLNLGPSTQITIDFPAPDRTDFSPCSMKDGKTIICPFFKA
jgi:hypothetical protein